MSKKIILPDKEFCGMFETYLKTIDVELLHFKILNLDDKEVSYDKAYRYEYLINFHKLPTPLLQCFYYVYFKYNEDISEYNMYSKSRAEKEEFDLCIMTYLDPFIKVYKKHFKGKAIDKSEVPYID